MNKKMQKNHVLEYIQIISYLHFLGVDQDSLNFMLWFTLLYSPLLKINYPSSKSINRGEVNKENKG